MPNSRRHHQATIALALTCGCVSLHGAEKADTVDVPLKLPTIKISADVPLLKTADYHLLTPRAAAATVTQGQYIFIIGGLGPDGELLKSIERFDTKTGKIEYFGELHAARMWHRAVAIGNHAYIIGGQNFTTKDLAKNPIDMGRDLSGYGKDPNAVRSRIKNEAAERQADYQARMNEAMIDARGGSYDSQVENGGRALKFEETIEILNLTTGQNKEGGEMPDPRAEFGCVVIGSDIYVLGGKCLVKGRLAFTNRTGIFDTVSRKWRNGIPVPAAIVCDATVVEGPFIVIAGGYTGTKKIDSVFAFNPHLNTWNSVAPLSRPTSAHSTVFLDKFLFLFGDYNSPEEILAYNLESKSSSLFTLQYIPSRHASAVCCDGKIFVIGGKRHRTSAPLDNIQQFELPKNISGISR